MSHARLTHRVVAFFIGSSDRLFNLNWISRGDKGLEHQARAMPIMHIWKEFPHDPLVFAFAVMVSDVVFSMVMNLENFIKPLLTLSDRIILDPAIGIS